MRNQGFVWGVSLLLLLVEARSSAVPGPHFTITTVLADPFTMRNAAPGESDETFVGFIPDLIRHLSERLGFSYNFKLSDDGKYGSPDATGNFNGMIGEVVRGEADIAAADLTITPMRDEAVDFTHPFLVYGLTGVRRSPTESEPAEVTLEDLASDDGPAFGFIAGGSTHSFFETSRDPMIERLYSRFDRAEIWAVGTLRQGIDRAKKGSYVFFTESTVIDYIVSRDPSLVSLGWNLEGSSRGNGLAMRENDPYMETLNDGLLQLREEGTLYNIYKKWWKPNASNDD